MAIKFFKYQATGNDFLIIDNRLDKFNKNNTKLIAKLCDRRFGIGSDGLILLESSTDYDFEMIYYNADGKQSSMCGNGGRCIVAFAKSLKIIQDTTNFMAIDGLHKATIDGSQVSLKMRDVVKISKVNGGFMLDTGSPHYVSMRSDLNAIDVKFEGSQIRNSTIFKKEGININFVKSINQNRFAVRTYERGVEDETFSCGTGVTATAIAMHASKETDKKRIELQTKGGILEVCFEVDNSTYVNVWLSGSAQYVFEGTIKNEF
ncbi:MAG: diaminopimelate epimerase [Flavobacteriaceae bacterium]|nr:diaminopimelate epimerase [Flavobacteriaceae bacterium]